MQPTFKSMRRDGAIKRGEANAVRLEDIHEEPGFNELARDYDADDVQAIEELAAFIKAGGIYPALEVRPRAEGGVWLVDGHLRSRALRLLDSRGDLPRTPNKENPEVLEAWVTWHAVESIPHCWRTTGHLRRLPRVPASRSQRFNASSPWRAVTPTCTKWSRPVR